MSVRAELLRLAIRLFLKPGLHPGISIDERRRKLGAYEGWICRPPAGTTSVELPLGTIPAIRVSRPDASPGRHILFLHGGGYITGSPALYRHILWRFAQSSRAEIAAIDYRLAPEHPFPAAVEDAVAAWKALLAEGADPEHCAVLGDSAGGGLALALALRLRVEGLPLPAAIVAISPWTDLAITGESCKNDSADPMLKSDCLKPFAAQYLQGADPCHPHASPLYGDLQEFPPTLIQVGSDEILRDDSTRMADRLRAAGCAVTLEVWPRMPHVWHAFAPLMPEAGRAIARVGEFVDCVLTGSGDRARPN
ncbi:MAG TPA: alpha/beta hydrolase [Rhizomicrobium sp.]|jgi:acetyl esterase/lipase|nr:alpha/beta hydrolase [Rhizomicrobium sp.]